MGFGPTKVPSFIYCFIVVFSSPSQVCGDVDNHGLHPDSSDELQKSNVGDGRAGGAQTLHLER